MPVTDSREQVEISSEVLGCLLAAFPTTVIIQRYPTELDRALNHPMGSVKLLVLNQVSSPHTAITMKTLEKYFMVQARVIFFCHKFSGFKFVWNLQACWFQLLVKINFDAFRNRWKDGFYDFLKTKNGLSSPTAHELLKGCKQWQVECIELIFSFRLAFITYGGVGIANCYTKICLRWLADDWVQIPPLPAFQLRKG